MKSSLTCKHAAFVSPYPQITPHPLEHLTSEQPSGVWDKSWWSRFWFQLNFSALVPKLLLISAGQKPAGSNLQVGVWTIEEGTLEKKNDLLKEYCVRKSFSSVQKTSSAYPENCSNHYPPFLHCTYSRETRYVRSREKQRASLPRVEFGEAPVFYFLPLGPRWRRWLKRAFDSQIWWMLGMRIRGNVVQCQLGTPPTSTLSFPLSFTILHFQRAERP